MISLLHTDLTDLICGMCSTNWWRCEGIVDSAIYCCCMRCCCCWRWCQLYAALYAIDRDRDRYDVYAAGYLCGMTSEAWNSWRHLGHVSSIDCITIAPAAQQLKYLWDTLAAYLSVCVCECVHLFSAAAVWLIESNARAHRMWVRHEFAFAFVSIAIAMNVSVSVAICICICLATTTTMTASILGICRLQINHFVGHKNRRQHCELIIEAKSRLDSRQLVATWGTQLKGVSSALVPGRKSIDMISGPAYAPLPPATLNVGRGTDVGHPNTQNNCIDQTWHPLVACGNLVFQCATNLSQVES